MTAITVKAIGSMKAAASLWICCWLMVIAISERLYRSALISGVHPQCKHPLTSERCTEECKQAWAYKYSPPNNAATDREKINRRSFCNSVAAKWNDHWMEMILTALVHACIVYHNHQVPANKYFCLASCLLFYLF